MSTLMELKRGVKQLSPRDRRQLLDWMAVQLDVGLFVTEPPAGYGAVALERDFYTIDEYLELQERGATAHEYVAGQIYAMAAPSQSHEMIVNNLLSPLVAHLRGRPCRAHSASRSLQFKCGGDDIVYRPDVWVGCGERRDAAGEIIEEPRLVIEVLSPSTARTDKREKALNYRELATLEECVLVAQKNAQVTIFRRAEEWKREVLDSPEDALDLRSVGLVLPIAQIYEGIS